MKRELRIQKREIIAMRDRADDLKIMAEPGVGIADHENPVIRERATIAFEDVGLGGVLELWGHWLLESVSPSDTSMSN